MNTKPLLWIFAISGFAGLVYQSIWTQYLGLFLGHAAHAQSLVLALFMGGMAIGAWIASRRTETLRSPLLAYALIEAIIGLLGLIFDGTYKAATDVAYQSMAATGDAALAFKLAVAAALVLPQCILLGATFPLMCAGYMRLSPRHEGSILSGLYFSNSIGAAIGALTSTYFLVPAIGLPGAMLTAGLMNIAVALAIYPLSKQQQAPLLPTSNPSSQIGAPLLVLLVAAATGATSFVYEITWVRMLSMALGTTIHAFELMLAAFIAGIALGGLWLRKRADTLPSPLATAGWVQVCMGVAALASMFVYANAFEWVAWLLSFLTRTAEGYNLFNIASAVIAMLVMFPAAFCAGMTLPLLTLVLMRQGGNERVIGQVYAVNTLGAIIGVVLTVHVLMPLLGLKLALMSAAAVDLLLGIILLRKFHAGPVHPGRTGVPVLAAIALSTVALALSQWLVRFDPLVLASSVYRNGTPRLEAASMLFYRDGKTASVAAFEQAETIAIATNGKVDAGIQKDAQSDPHPDEYTMALVAALPLSMRDNIGRVGIIGFGSGLTTHTLLGSTRVEHVDTIEIEPMMVEGAKQFGNRVERAYRDPRSRIVIDDAKSYFSSSPARYDLIMSEPSNPWMGGTASLFSKEFYAFVPRHLNQHGIFVQWLQLYEIDATLVSSVLNAMLPHFSDVRAYLANGTDLILVATPKGRLPDLGSRLFEDAALRVELSRLGIQSVRDLQDHFLMNRSAVAAFTEVHPAPANSDFFPFLQLNAPAARFMNASVNLNGWHAAPWPVTGLMGGFRPRALSESLTAIGKPLAIGSKQQAARELRMLLLGSAITGEMSASPERIDQALALRSLGKECRLDAAPERSATLILTLASDTTAFLDSAAQEPIWRSPTWNACPITSPVVQRALALADAAASLDHPRTITTARLLLDDHAASGPITDPVAAHYVAGSLLFASWATDRQEIARDFAHRDLMRLPPRVRANDAFNLLLATALGPGRFQEAMRHAPQ